MTKDIPQTAPSVVLIEDISRSDGWEKQKSFKAAASFCEFSIAEIKQKNDPKYSD